MMTPVSLDDKKKVPNWNKFQQIPREDVEGSGAESAFFKRAEQLLLIVAYVLSFLIVLTGCVVARGLTFFMITQTSVKNRNNLPFCNGDNATGFYILDAQEYQLEVDLHCKDLKGTSRTECQLRLGVERSAWIWCIFFAYLFPNLGAFLRSFRIWLFKKQSFPKLHTFFFALIMECCHVIGMCLLVFLVLPELDSIRGMILTCGMATVPCIFNIRSKFQQKDEKGSNISKYLSLALDVVALVCQLSAVLVWPLVQSSESESYPEHPYSWAIPLSLLLITCSYWESYVGAGFGSRWLWSMKKELLETSRYSVYVVVLPVKIMLFLAGMILLTYLNGSVTSFNDDLDYWDILFNSIGTSFGNHTFTVKEVTTDTITSSVFSDAMTSIAYYEYPVDNKWTPTLVLFIQIACGYAVYVVGKFASKVQIGLVGFAAPLTMVIPVSLLILFLGCGSFSSDKCAFDGVLPHNLSFECPNLGDLGAYMSDQYVWMFFLWYLSFLWINIHVWYPRSTRLASSEQIFSLPWYEGLFIDQMMMMNRRKDGDLELKVSKTVEEDQYDEDATKQFMKNFAVYEEDPMLNDELHEDLIKPEDKVTRIKACATMWHENKEEMVEMLRSLFRVDIDYCSRRLSEKQFEIKDQDFYEWETHILFDDSMTNKNKEEKYVVNNYVENLVLTMHDAASDYYSQFNNGCPVAIPQCKKIPTPYGGRLIWELPGGTKVIVHLKVNEKIRHKKRWSQCMYMYYLLGYQLMDNPELSIASKNERAKNTYLLALDGDIDFQPHSIVKLVDMMKKNSKVGAACGRIHPTGSGYIPWYQKFEYAVGHWLQKATEHVLGCVLCSPGCFSLFRGEALMDSNVMRKYTTTSTEPRHYVQFDQGEDRWLCTLLLQQGWRVEYSAASDAFTACPEGFDEFYNQRRRWMPSTIMNIVDLLADYKHVVEMNPDISIFYILYQGFLMVSTFIGPGAIFLVIAGAFNTVFGFSMWNAILINAVPVFIFMAACYWLDAKIQLFLAKLLTVAYVLLMLAVMIGIFVQIIEEGSWWSPTALSFFSVFGAFFLAGILHPYEIGCLPYLIIYYITIPSMYLLLVIYSLFNLWNVSWGTREVPKETDVDEKAEALKKQAEASKDEGFLEKVLTQLNMNNKKGQKGGMELSLGNLFSCMLFTHEDPEKKQMDEMHGTLNEIYSKVKRMDENRLAPNFKNSGWGQHSNMEKHEASDNKTPLIEPEKVKTSKAVKASDREEASPHWLDNFEERFDNGGGKVEHLSKAEVTFWVDLIKEYLTPLTMTDKQKEDQLKGLKAYRDGLVFTFVMANLLWVLGISMMQFQKSILSIPWMFDKKYNTTYTLEGEQGPELVVMSTSLQLEPIGLLFLIAFLGVMILQIIGMILHRWTSFSHTIATTKLGKEAVLAKEALEYVKKILSQSEHAASQKSKIEEAKAGRRGTVANIMLQEERQKVNPGILNIEAAFNRRHSEVKSKNLDDASRRLSMRRDTLANLQRRDSTTMKRHDELDRRNERRNTLRNSIAMKRRDSGIPGYDMDHDLAEFQRRYGMPQRRPSRVSFSTQGTDNDGFADYADTPTTISDPPTYTSQDNNRNLHFEFSESKL